MNPGTASGRDLVGLMSTDERVSDRGGRRRHLQVCPLALSRSPASWMRVALSALLLLVGQGLQARELPPDPTRSVMWESMAKRFMPEGEIVFDDRIRLMVPESAENQFEVPVTIDATALEDVEEIVAMADLNPIPLILRLRPAQALGYVGFRLKLEQGSPIHVGARTRDGRWHVAAAYVDAAGGGCTAPAAAHGTNNWMARLGETRARVQREGPAARMSLRMRHPMDTGLADGIPVFYMSDLEIRNAEGELLADVDLYEPVSENPTLTLKPMIAAESETLTVSARDTEGNEFDFGLEVPAVGSN